MTIMGRYLVIILSITAGISFLSGMLTAKRAVSNIESSMDDLFKSIELIEEVHSLNKQPAAKIQGPRRLLADPQI